MSSRSLFASAVALALLAATGCSPTAKTQKLIPVSGSVKVNGSPVSGLKVYFEPTEGRRSSGLTDASGNYQMMFSDSALGATEGPNQVRIVWSGEDPNEDEFAAPASVDLTSGTALVIPSRYNARTQLNADVSEQNNHFDFDLKM
ncbi:hypothetical protein [Bremerella cremea]|uniref:hypothetical protein n=1 Tax=Bremerella cremea TaxID=1031537 RepID=UPI0031EBF64F